MEMMQRKGHVRRNKLQLLDSSAPQFETFIESREQYIQALEETLELLKRERLTAAENNIAIRNSISELMAMQQLSNSISTAQDPEEIVATLIHLTRQVMPVAESNVFVFENGSCTLTPLSSKISDGFRAEAEAHVESGVVDWVITEQRTAIFPEMDTVATNGKQHIVVIVPLIMRNEAVGMYMIRSPRSHHEISNHDMQLLNVLANQAAVGIENWRSHDQLKRMNEELKASQAQTLQAAKLAAIGELAASIVHEIKNPIQVLMMHMEMVQRGKPLPNWTDMLAKQIKRLSEITRRLMNFSRNNVEEPKMEEVSVKRAIEETVAMVQHEYRNNNIEIKAQLSDDIPPIIGNSNYLQQVFLNLLINARDAMPTGGTITFATESSGYYVIIKVSDTGCGIDNENLSKIFMPFFTTKGEGVGTGLGLSVCRKIISEHKGELKVESTVGVGTTFTIFLPTRRSRS